MNAIFLTLFVSGVLVIGMVLLFAVLFSQHSHEQSDRMVLLPLQDEPSQTQEIDRERGATSIAARKLR